MKKRILFLSPLPPPNYGSAMSSEMCLNFLKESKEFEIKNIKLNYSRKISDIGKLNLNKIKGLFHVKKEIKKSIDEFKPNLIYFVSATSSLGFWRDYIFYKQVRKYYSGKIIFHIRSRILEEDWKRDSFRRKFANMLKGQKAIVLGKELIKDVHGIIHEENLFVLPNAIENELSQKDFMQILEERKKRKSFNILFLSNMDFFKGWPKLLKACKILKNQKINFICNFVGAFPGEKEKTFFFDFVKENNLDKNVFYLGKKTGRDKNKILENSDILVFPTEYKLETFGRVIIEAMMFGLPVIANGIATISSIISDGKTGFVLRENSPREISEKIIQLKDKNLRLKMGKEGRKRFLEKYELEKYGKNFEKILKTI